MDNKENVPNGGNNERPPKIMLSKVPGMQLGEGAFGTVCAYWDKRNNYYAVKEINEKNVSIRVSSPIKKVIVEFSRNSPNCMHFVEKRPVPESCRRRPYLENAQT